MKQLPKKNRLKLNRKFTLHFRKLIHYQKVKLIILTENMDQKAQLVNFAKILAGITIALFLCYIILIIGFPKLSLSPMIPVIIPFFAILTGVLFYLKLKFLTSKSSKFINIFVLTNSLKLLLLILIVALYAYFFRSDAINFTISFFICYTIYSFILVRQFNRIQRKF